MIRTLLRRTASLLDAAFAEVDARAQRAPEPPPPARAPEPVGPRAPTMMPYRDVPILINSYNRVESLRRLVSWLSQAGYRNLIIVDNASRYPPLISYLAELEQRKRASIVRLEENAGHTALWDRNLLERLDIRTEFVYSDPDVVPAASCPHDVVGYLQSLLQDEPSVAKAGLGLRLDDLPATYQHRETVIGWERQFWLKPAFRGAFSAPVDTTFALYRPGGGHGLDAQALRTGWPYVAAHEGWYVNSAEPTEEGRFYAEIAHKSSNWSVDRIPEWLESESRRLAQEHPRVLHLGCGRDLIPGYLNVDDAPGVNADIRFNLDHCATQRLPIEDGSVDGFYMCHVLEHVEATLPLLEELHRVAKKDAKLVIRLPYASTNDAFEDPTHRRAYSENSFVYFSQPAYSRADYGYRGDWRIERVVLVVPRGLADVPRGEVLERIRTLRNVVHEMIVHLRAVKPPRPPSAELLTWPQPEIAFSRIDENAGFQRLP